MGGRGTVFVVDDDARLRRALVLLLGECGYDAQQFASAREFLDALDSCQEGCLLLDLRMPVSSGLELQEELEKRAVFLPIVFLTGHADVPTSVLAMKRGAVDFLEKPVGEEALLAALDRALARGSDLRAQRSRVAAIEALYARLTDREREVFWLLVSGRLNKQAAALLGIALRTVKHHRAHVLTKMGAHTTADLARMGTLLRDHQPPGFGVPSEG